MWQLRNLGLFLLTASLAAAPAAAQGVRWRTDLEAAKGEAAHTGRLVLLHFGATWCKPCKNLDETVFIQPQVAQAIEQQFVPVKFDVDHSRPIARQYEIGPIPADVVIAPTGEVMGRGTGYLPAAKYLDRLSGIAASAGRKPFLPPSGASQQIAGLGPAPYQPSSNGPRVGQKIPELPPPLTANPPSANALSGNGSLFMPPAPSGSPSAPLGTGLLDAPPLQHAPQTPINPQAQAAVPPGIPADLLSGTPSNTPPSGAPSVAERPKAHNGPPAATPPGQPGLPPLGFEGYCVVTLHRDFQYAKGDPQWGVIHEDRLYLFSTPQAKDQFLRDPHRYATVMSGYDVVILVETGQRVPGERRFGATFHAAGENSPRIYLFANEASVLKFMANPIPYIERLRQMRGRPLVQQPSR
jgi:thiol-disulfide isomerase/thioredoxin/YHS domain-containing protein